MRPLVALALDCTRWGGARARWRRRWAECAQRTRNAQAELRWQVFCHFDRQQEGAVTVLPCERGPLSPIAVDGVPCAGHRSQGKGDGVRSGFRADEDRRVDANELTNPQHLIAVTASANRSKGDRGPEEWRPPDEGYWCTYATDWVGVKVTWSLAATQAEWDSVEEMLGRC